MSCVVSARRAAWPRAILAPLYWFNAGWYEYTGLTAEDMKAFCAHSGSRHGSAHR